MSVQSLYTSFSLDEIASINPTRPRELLSLSPEHEVTFVPMPAVNQLTGTIQDAQTRPFKEVRKGFTYFEEGDVIFAKITPCMQNGKCAVARDLTNRLGFGSTEFHVVRPDLTRVLPQWIWYFLRQETFREIAKQQFRGGVGQQRVPKEFVAATVIPVPSLNEQTRILEKIDECEDRLQELGRIRAESQRDTAVLRHAIFADHVEALAADSTAVLGEFLVDCKYGTSSKANSNGKGVPVLRMGNIQDARLDVSKLKHIELPTAELSKVLLKNGDILVNRTNSLELVGKAAVFSELDGPWCYASYLIRLRVDPERILPEYVNAVINSRIGRSYVYSTARRAIGMVNINAKEIKQMPMPCPPIEDQRLLITKIQKVQPLVAELEEGFSVPNVEELRESILRKAFAGEL